MRDRLAAVERAAAGVAGAGIVAAALAALVAPEPWDVAGVVVLATGSVTAVMAGPVVLRAWLAGRRPAPAVGRARAPYPPLPVVDAAGDVYADQPIYVPPARPAVPVDPVDQAAAEAILTPDSRQLPTAGCGCDYCQTLRAAVTSRLRPALPAHDPAARPCPCLGCGMADLERYLRCAAGEGRDA